MGIMERLSTLFAGEEESRRRSIEDAFQAAVGWRRIDFIDEAMPPLMADSFRNSPLEFTPDDIQLIRERMLGLILEQFFFFEHSGNTPLWVRASQWFSGCCFFCEKRFKGDLQGGIDDHLTRRGFDLS